MTKTDVVKPQLKSSLKKGAVTTAKPSTLKVDFKEPKKLKVVVSPTAEQDPKKLKVVVTPTTKQEPKNLKATAEPAESDRSSWLRDEEAHQIVIPFQLKSLYLLAVGRASIPFTLWVHWTPSALVSGGGKSLSSKHSGARICSYNLSQTQFDELEAITGSLSQVNGTKKLQEWLRAFVADSTEREHTAFPRLIGQLL